MGILRCEIAGDRHFPGQFEELDLRELTNNSRM